MNHTVTHNDNRTAHYCSGHSFHSMRTEKGTVIRGRSAMPWSEVCMHIGVADKEMDWEITAGDYPMVQLYEGHGEYKQPYSSSITLGEACLRWAYREFTLHQSEVMATNTAKMTGKVCYVFEMDSPSKGSHYITCSTEGFVNSPEFEAFNGHVLMEVHPDGTVY